MFKSFARLLCAIAFAALLSGCDILPSGDATPPAAELLPDLPGYNVVEGQRLTDYLSSLSEGAALLAGHPELTVTIAAVDRIISCYQEVGAARARVYSNAKEPLSAGTVAIADRNALLDPKNLFKCVAPEVKTKALAIEPCSATYTLSRNGNEFYILYAGTTLEICHTFCANLEGCTAHK